MLHGRCSLWTITRLILHITGRCYTLSGDCSDPFLGSFKGGEELDHFAQGPVDQCALNDVLHVDEESVSYSMGDGVDLP